MNLAILGAGYFSLKVFTMSFYFQMFTILFWHLLTNWKILVTDNPGPFLLYLITLGGATVDKLMYLSDNLLLNHHVDLSNFTTYPVFQLK